LGDNVQTVEVKSSEVKIIEFQNRPFGSLVIKKVDKITGKALIGAQFSVYHQGGEFVGEYETGADGTVNIPAVAPGFYVVTETRAPSGYLLENTAKTVEVKAVVPTVVTFNNSPLSGIEILKTDEFSHVPLTGARFEVTRANGEKIAEVTTDRTGKALATNLDEGVYIISEIYAPSGYVRSEIPQTVTVKSGKLTSIEFTNRPLSGLEITKIDYFSKVALIGAVFTVERTNGGKIGEFTTDETGKIIIPNLQEGVYIISEITPPNGYVISEQPKTVEVVSGKLTAVKFADKPLSGLEIVKLDSISRAPIAGVEFTISKMNGEKIMNEFGSLNFKTGIDGAIYIKNLTDGYYTICEIKQAEGYFLDSEPKTVLVEADRDTVLEVLNVPMSGLLIVKTKSSRQSF
jgi:uncharacterized surface anchored protein